ncbi:MAG: histidine kinase, partial [Bacteroidota bacterium]
LYQNKEVDSAAVSIAARKLAGILVKEHLIDSAKALLQFALQINHHTHKNAIFILTSLADIYSSEGEGDSALYYLSQSDPERQTDLGRLLLDLGFADAYLAKGNLQIAEKYNKSAILRINKKLESDWVRKALRQEMRIRQEKGDFQNAFESLQNLKAWEDSLLNFEQQRALLKLERQYQYEADIRNLQKEKELQRLQLRQRNLQLMAIVLVFITLLLISYLIYNRKMHKRDREANELNQQLLRIQLNPHFIFNALSSIQSFILTNNNRAASISLAKFGELTRDILDTSREAYITLDKELKMLRNYVDIQKTRFEGALVLETDIDAGIDEEMVMVPPMFIQPFVENSLEHGLDRVAGGRIRLKLRKKGEELSVEISDNGMGLSQNQKSKAHTSRAVSIIQERLERIKGKHQQWLTVENIMSNQQIRGVVVRFTLPFMTH